MRRYFTPNKPTTVMLLGLIVQAPLLLMIDPLGYPDTLRYFNFAKFLATPNILQTGDLAFENGLLFTPLFLPSILMLLRSTLALSFESTGLLIQLASFQILLLGLYTIAKHQLNSKIALLSCLVFCAVAPFYATFILTEIPFLATLIWIIHIICKNSLAKDILKVSVLSLLLTSIRDQGFVIVVFLTFFCLTQKRISFKHTAYIILPAFSLMVFTNLFFNHLNEAYPQRLANNTAFTQSSFVLGSRFAEYDYSISGPIALTANKSLVDLATNNTEQYFDKLSANTSKLIQYYSSQHLSFGLLLILSSSLLLYYFRTSDIFSIAFSLTTLTLVFLVASLTPDYALKRYLAILFPFAAIAFAKWIFDLSQSKNKVLLLLPLAFLIYYSLYSFKTFSSHYPLGLTENHRLNTRIAADQINEAIGNNKYIALTDTRLYCLAYRSANKPAYFNGQWNKAEIQDFIHRRKRVWLLSDQKMLKYLDRKGQKTSKRTIIPFKNSSSDFLVLYELLTSEVSIDDPA